MEKDIAGKNLQLLLGSLNGKNARLGLELAMNVEIPLPDLTDVVALALFHKQEEVREVAQDVLQVRSSKDMRLHLQTVWEPTYADGESSVFFAAVAKVGTHPQLSQRKLLQLAVLHTWRFPEQEAHIYPDAFLAHCDRHLSEDGHLKFNRFPIPFLPSEFAEWERQNRLTKLTMNNCGLKRLPAYVGGFRDLVELDLSGNHLEDLPDELGNLKNLQYLWVNHNQLSHIQESLKGLTSLLNFDCYQNPITQFPKVIAQLPLLNSHRFDVRADVDYAPLADCQQLKNLSLLDFAPQATFPLEVGSLTQLTLLNISGYAQPQPLPAVLKQLQALTEVNLKLTQQQAVPEFLLHQPELYFLHYEGVGPMPTAATALSLPKLEHLHLEDISWPAWPAAWNNLPQLKYLDLKLAGFTGLPPEFSQLTQLTSITLENIPLGHFPAVLLEFLELELLYLHNTRITALPEDLDRLSKLHYLSVSGSDLRVLPAALFRMQQLKTLTFSNVKLNVQDVKRLSAALPDTDVQWK